jgi:hypothetical protein
VTDSFTRERKVYSCCCGHCTSQLAIFPFYSPLFSSHTNPFIERTMLLFSCQSLEQHFGPPLSLKFYLGGKTSICQISRLTKCYVTQMPMQQQQDVVDMAIYDI